MIGLGHALVLTRCPRSYGETGRYLSSWFDQKGYQWALALSLAPRRDSSSKLSPHLNAGTAAWLHTAERSHIGTTHSGLQDGALTHRYD